jgi:type II secretory pathway component GspD/PulD (secretin)
MNRKAFTLAAAIVLGVASFTAIAQPESKQSSGAVPIATVLDAVAKRSGKKFIVDPRVQGDVLVLQQNPTSLSYDELLMVLQVHGFAAVATGDYVRVVPEANIRQLPIPVATGDKHAQAEYVSRIVAVKNVPAHWLVPVFRPLLPQQAHMVAMTCTNDLLIVDTFGNIQRLEKLIRAIDRGEPYVPSCTPVDAPTRQEKRSDK